MQLRTIKKGITVAAAASMATLSLHASAYKIPEQSVRSMALSAAYVSGAQGADTSYYNPAKMGWVKSAQAIEGDLTVIHLPPVEFTGTVNGYPADAESKEEDFLVPMLHYVGPRFGNWRFGFSLTAPGGLSKRWNRQPQRSKAEEFTLAIIEANPTFSYTFNDQWSVGGGVRVVYTDGTVRIYGEDNAGHFLYADNMEGDSFDFGYNLAVAYRPQSQTILSVTYRSNVDLTVDGTAKGGGAVGGMPAWFDVDADVEVPLPATLALAVSHDFGRVRLEAVYERTFWSRYDKLDFNFDNRAVEGVLGRPIQKDWDDTDTFRIGLTWHVDDRWDMMFGYAWDESPIPEKSIGFELPDSDANIFSVGTMIRIDEHWEAGFSMLYDKKDKRSVSTPPNENGIDGTFDKGGAYLATVGVGYRF